MRLPDEYKLRVDEHKLRVDRDTDVSVVPDRTLVPDIPFSSWGDLLIQGSLRGEAPHKLQEEGGLGGRAKPSPPQRARGAGVWSRNAGAHIFVAFS